MTGLWFEILVGLIVLGGFMFAVASLTFTVTRALSAVSKEDIARLEANRREDTARLEASIAKLDAKIDSSIKAINDKFDRYLFRKVEKTDDAPK